MAAASEVVMFGFSIPSFLEQGILCLLTLFSLAVVYVTLRFIAVLRQSSRLRRRLDDVLFEGTVSQETIDELDAAFASARGYDERWRQLRRSLAVAQPETGGAILVSSVPVRQIFNPPEILGAWFNMRLIDTVPALLSNLGLLLTFLAILFGLNGAFVSGNSSSTTETLIEFEKMRLGIVHLVSNLSGKFLASVCALGASFLFVLYERIVVIWSLSAISSIPRGLDQIIQFQSADRVLREIQQAVVESVNRSRIVSAHIPQYIRQEVHHAAGATLERIEGALQQLCAIATTVKKRETGALPPGLGDMPVGVLGEIQGIAGHLKTMNLTLEETTRSFKHMSVTLGDSMGHMVSASKALEGSVQQQAAYAKEQLEVILNSLEVVGGRMQEAVAGTARTFTVQLDEAANKIKGSVDDAVAALAARLPEDVASNDAAAQIREVLEPLVARATSMVGEVNKAAIGISKASAALQATAGAVEKGTVKFGEIAQSAEKLIDRRDDGAEHLREVLERNGAALDGLISLAPAIKESIASALANTFEASEERHANALSGLQQQLLDMGIAQQAAIQDSWGKNAVLLGQIQEILGETITRGTDQLSSWEKGVYAYLAAAEQDREHVLGQVETFGKRFETVVGSAVQTIATSVKESASELQEVISRIAAPPETLDASSRQQRDDDLEARIRTGLGGIERLGGVLESSAEILERGASALDSVVHVAGEIGARGAAITDQTRALLDQHGLLLEQHRHAFESFDRGITEMLGKLNAQVIEYNAETLEELRRHVIEGASEHFGAVSRAVEDTTSSLEKIPALLVESSRSILSASRQFEESLQQRASQAGADLTRAVGGLESAGSRLSSVIETGSERFSSAVEESTGRFEAVVTHAAATLSAIAKREREGTEVLEQAKGAWEKALGQVTASFSGLGDTFESFQVLTEAIQESAEAVGNGTVALSEVVTATRQLQSREEVWSSQMRQIFEQNNESLTNYQEVFKTLDQSIAKIMTQLEEQIWRFQSRVQEQLEWSLQHYDELSARGLVAFESAITNLSDVLIGHRAAANGSQGNVGS